MRHIKHQHGFSIIGLLVSIVILGLILTFAVPAFFGTDEQEDTTSVVGAAESTATPLNGAMVEAAAELAYMNGDEQVFFTLGELVELGYLNTDLTDEQYSQTVTHTGNGAYTYQP